MSTDDGGTWAPFGPSGDDEEPAPRPATPQPEPPPVQEPEVQPAAPPVEDLPPAAFAPPVAPAPPPTSLNWPAPEPPAPAPPPISTWPGAAPTPYGTPKRTAGNATASLVLGIVGLVMCPLIASAAAIGLGTSAKREIRENPEQLTGESIAKWGVALGWVGVAFGVLGIIAVIAGAASV